ncbi:hypothetical protein MTO96_036600, partial [Rhipicephalus appendiculatus]
SPGHPDISWEQWIQAFKDYVIDSGASDLPAIRRKAMLLNCLGLERLRIFQALKTTDDPCHVAASAAGGTLRLLVLISSTGPSRRWKVASRAR